MVCLFSRRPVAKTAPQDEGLISVRPGFHEAHAFRRRLFDIPSTQSTPASARSTGQDLLYVASTSAKGRLKPQRQPQKAARFPHRTLLWSRENVKRFLRSSWPPKQLVPSTASSPSHWQPNLEAQSRSVEDMVSVDGGGQSPIRRGRNSIQVRRPTSSVAPPPQSAVQEVSNASSQPNGHKYTAPLSTLCDEKPIASGSGICVAISLAESVLYLQGFDQNDSDSRNTTMLRGSLHLHVTKQVKLKAISLNFRGKAETEWPEGIPPRKTDFRDSETIMNHTWPFFNAQFPQAEHGYCADLVHLTKGPSVSTKELGVTASSFDRFHRSASPCPHPRSRDADRLSLQMNQSRSFGKGDNMHGGPTVAQKGFKIFHPGDYVYNFELPLDSRLPETIDVALGNVKYELEALVERSGAFRPNLVGTKQLLMIRAPAEGSLEQVEPIAISRNWEDQLHYDIVVSGKSFPLGSSVPIAFKLTPLAKVQCHRIKVCVTENIQYFTANKRVHRLEPTRQVQLFEKRADAPSTSAYPGSTIRISAGGGIAWDSREAAARGEEIVQHDASNLLGDLDHDNASIGPTEMEFSVKLPSCHEMKDRPLLERLHFDTTYQNIQVNHWIKIMLRLSKQDENNPGKRRHFEVSIDSPLHILSCRATAANTSLPAYSTGKVSATPADEVDCGCPGAATKPRTTFPRPVTSEGQSTSSFDLSAMAPVLNWTENTAGLATPTPAHVHDPSSGVQNLDSRVSRPMHLLRSPSFNPPPFSDEQPPPPLMTPPPNYENSVQVDSRHALADYFSRLANEMADEDEPGDRGRVDVPLTPGGRINRSMDASRSWVPLGTQAGN